MLIDAGKQTVVLEILIIERVSAENWPALGELKIKTETPPEADFLMNNSWDIDLLCLSSHAATIPSPGRCPDLGVGGVGKGVWGGE